MPAEYLNLSDIARARGMTRQGISYLYAAGQLPKPDGWLGARRSPIWKRSTLEKRDCLQAVSKRKSKESDSLPGAEKPVQVSVTPLREAQG